MSQPLDRQPQRFNRFAPPHSIPAHSIPAHSPEAPITPENRLQDVPEISAAALQQLLNTDPDRLLLLDVRYPGEYAIYHLPGALLIPFPEIKQAKGIDRVRAMLADWQAKHPGCSPHLIVYCTAGIRSAKALRFLQKAGINGTNLAGGMQAWETLPALIPVTATEVGSASAASPLHPLQSIGSSSAHTQANSPPNSPLNSPLNSQTISMTQVQQNTGKTIASTWFKRQWLYASLGFVLLAGGLLTWYGSRYIYNPDRLRPFLQAGVPLQVLEDMPIVGDAVKSAELPQITVQELQQKIESNANDYLLIDVRSAEEYNDGSIPGAVSIPLTEIEAGKGIEQVKSMLHDRQLIAYCTYSYRSGKALVKLEEAGINGVQVEGGIVTWNKAHNPTVAHQ